MIDFSELDSVIERIQEATEHAIPVAIDAERGQIWRRTKRGVDADNETFHPYGPSQFKKRENAGLTTSVKTIEFSGATMASLARYNDNELTVDDEHMPIMVGQMQHPKWSYHHNVLGVNVTDDVPVMEKALETMIQEVVR